MNIEVNYVAILVAGIVSMVIGFVWYGPMLFAKPWMKEMGITAESMKKDQSKLGKIYSISFILSLLTAYILSHVMTFSINFPPNVQNSPMTTALNTAFWMWLGFVAPVQLTDVLFGGKSNRLFLINTGYQLASLLGMAITLALFWR